MKWVQILKLSVSLSLLAVAFYLLDWTKLFAAVKEITPWIFIWAVFISILVNGVLAIRWHQLTLKIASLPLLENFKHYFYGSFLNFFTPANIGGDAYRLIALKRHVPRSFVIITTLLRERYLGLLSFFIGFIFCFGSLFIFNTSSLITVKKIYYYTGCIVALGTAGLIFTSPIITAITQFKRIRSRERVVNILNGFRDAAHFDSLADFLKLMGLSLVALFGWLITVGIVGVDLGMEISWFYLGATVILVELARLIPISIQGIGVREGMYAYLFTASAQGPETGFMLGTISYLALSLSLLISGLIGWLLMYFIPAQEGDKTQINQ